MTGRPHHRASSELTVALVSEVFTSEDAATRLEARLRAARDRGAELAVLPELPLDPWVPADETPRAEDEEPPGGPRHQRLQTAARNAGIAVLGGAIVVDPDSGARHNSGILVTADGEVKARYAKLHLPQESGFWEANHYEPGTRPPAVVDGFALPLGIQICSDVNRPQGSQLLSANGAELILAPRATELATWPRWRPVLLANAMTCATFIVSVNRPEPERGVELGGPSFVVDPTGEVLLETTDRLAVVTLERTAIERARLGYPGYLDVRHDLYARAWREVGSEGKRA